MRYRYSSIMVWVTEGAALVKLNKARDGITLSAEVKSELADFLAAASRDSRIRSVALTGNGRAFSVGGSLEARLAGQKGFIRHAGKGKRFLDRLVRELGKPTVAAVNGHAIGAGMALALACDVVIAADDAVFYEISAGGHGLWDGAVRRLRAAEAAQLGLVSRIVRREELVDEAAAIAMRLASTLEARLRGGGTACRSQAARRPECALAEGGLTVAL